MLAIVACKSHSPEPPPAPDPLAVEVTSAGAEPRRVLRYHVAKGTHATLELAVDATLTAGELGGAMPTFVFDLDIAVDDVTADGHMQLRTTIANATARDRPGAKIAASAIGARLATMKDLTITGTLAPDGKLTATRLDPATTAKLAPEIALQLGSLATSLENVALPLPRAAVGVGAKWRAERALEQNGMHTTATSTIEATAIDGDRVSLQVTTELHGADQSITQQGTTVDVSHLGGAGGGKAVVDLAHFTITGELGAKLHADMSSLGQSTPLNVEMKTTIAPRDQGAHSAP